MDADTAAATAYVRRTVWGWSLFTDETLQNDDTLIASTSTLDKMVAGDFLQSLGITRVVVILTPQTGVS